ncbi:MAG: CotH kinase family protein, partial [Myxococcota bacterium]
TIELELIPERLAFLDSNPAAEIYVLGSAIIEGVRYDGVGIRYKGSIGAFVFCTDSPNPLDPTGPKSCPKLSMKVKFNEFAPGQRFYGVKRLQFHAMNFDPGMMVERMGYSLFREMGVAASRTAYVRLVINGAVEGIFLLVEQVDGQFVRSRFSEGGEGNLYKEAWPITSNPDYYLGSLRTNRDEDPTADKIVAFYEALQSDASEAVVDWLNIDYMMRYFAVDRAINNDDGAMHFYCGLFGPDGCANHNYFWYEEVARDRLWLVPWDLDNAAFGAAFNLVAFPGDWRDDDPSCVPEPGPIPFLPPAVNPACDPMIHALGDYSGLYQERQQELLDGPFAQERVEQKIDAWIELLRDEVIAAHEANPLLIDAAAWEATAESFKASLTAARQGLAEDIAAHPE